MITLTGGKYAQSTLTSVGTTTITDSTAPFVSGDFTSIRRMIGLWSSAGAFKGITYVRQYSSTSVLELEAAFFQPWNGTTVTQVSGDKYIVSKTWAECATAGLSVSGKTVTITDQLTLGTAGTGPSLCLYDEFVQVNFTSVGDPNVSVAGGVTVQGHLLDYANDLTYGDCTWKISGGAFTAFIRITDTAGAFSFFGGELFSQDTPAYIGGYLGTYASCFVLDNVTSNGDHLSVNAGDPWGGNASRHVLRNMRIYIADHWAIATRWGDGAIKGGFFRAATAEPLGVFGGDALSTTIGADAGERLRIYEVGNGGSTPTLFRNSVPGSPTGQTVDYTNVVTPNRVATGSVGGIIATNITMNFYFSDIYTRVATGSLLVIQRASGTVETSTTGSGSVTMTIQEAQITSGNVESVIASSWTFGAISYSYLPYTTSFTTATVTTLSGSAKDVSFGGLVSQAVDSSVTLSLSAANALTSIATLSDLYDRAQAWKVASSTNAIYPTLATQLISADGTQLNLGSCNLVVDATAGSAFAVNTGTNTITIKASTLASSSSFTTFTTTGTITLSHGAVLGVAGYTSTAGSFAAVSATGLTSGSRVQLYDVTSSTELQNQIVSATSISWYTAVSTHTLRLRVAYQSGTSAKNTVELTGVMSASGVSFLVAQTAQTVYNANAIDGSGVTEFSSDYPNIQVDINDPDGTTTLARLFAWYHYIITTSSGIANFFGALTAGDTANYLINSSVVGLKLDNVSGSPVIITGGYLSRSDATTVIATTSGSIQLDPGKAYITTGSSAALSPTDLDNIADAVLTDSRALTTGKFIGLQ